MSEQNFENHGKFVPSYHFFAVPVFLINFLWSLYRLRKLGISFEGNPQLPQPEAGDFLRRNLWSDFGRGPRGPGLPGATICAGGAGPRHPARGAAALRTGAARRSSGKNRRSEEHTNCFAEVCERRGVTGAGAKSAG